MSDNIKRKVARINSLKKLYNLVLDFLGGEWCVKWR